MFWSRRKEERKYVGTRKRIKILVERVLSDFEQSSHLRLTNTYSIGIGTLQ